MFKHNLSLRIGDYLQVEHGLSQEGSRTCLALSNLEECGVKDWMAKVKGWVQGLMAIPCSPSSKLSRKGLTKPGLEYLFNSGILDPGSFP